MSEHRRRGSHDLAAWAAPYDNWKPAWIWPSIRPRCWPCDRGAPGVCTCGATCGRLMCTGPPESPGN